MNQNKIFKEYNNLCFNIKNYRKMRNLTQEGLAEKAFCSTSYIKQIESTKCFKNISFLTILKICLALDIDVIELFKVPKKQNKKDE